MQIKVDKDECTGCMECVEICSQSHFNVSDPKKAALRIAKEGDDFYPVVCDQCGECAQACPTEVIEKKTEEGKENSVVYVVNEDECMLCTMCVGACPKNLLHEINDTDAMFKCDLCLKCTEICPSGALTADD